MKDGRKNALIIKGLNAEIKEIEGKIRTAERFLANRKYGIEDKCPLSNDEIEYLIKKYEFELEKVCREKNDFQYFYMDDNVAV